MVNRHPARPDYTSGEPNHIAPESISPPRTHPLGLVPMGVGRSGQIPITPLGVSTVRASPPPHCLATLAAIWSTMLNTAAVGGVDGAHRGVDGHVVAHGQRTLTGKSASAHLSVGGARLNRQSLSGILALSSDITAPVPLTSIPVVPIAVLISAGVSSSRSRTSVATGGGAPLLQEATKMNALASASTTVSCRMFISPTPRPARGACGAAESGMCTVEYPRGCTLAPAPVTGR
jgi:hypothetical protein